MRFGVRERAPRRRARANQPAADRRELVRDPAIAMRHEPDRRVGASLMPPTPCASATTRSMSAASTVGASAPRAWTKNSMLPSAPRSGDVDDGAHAEPDAVERADNLVQHRVVHDRLAHDPTLADACAPGLELRLHEQHELGIVGGERAAGWARPCAAR